MSDYDFSHIVNKVAANENIQNAKLELQYSSNKGDGYMGNIRAAQIIGTNKQIDVVFKYVHQDPNAHKTAPMREAYLTEINYYDTIAPNFANFQAKYKIDKPFNNSAKFYGSVTEPLKELLVLENLRTRNYDLWNRKQLMNKEHLQCALFTFAKFHGTSFAMQKLDKPLYKTLAKSADQFDLFAEFTGRMKFPSQLKESIPKLYHIFDPNTETLYREKLENFNERIHEVFDHCLSYRNRDVILQGDCWCNNAMYQYEDMNNRVKPKHMMMLDFQAVRVGPPTLDLTYFFYSIAPKEALDKLEFYQKYYYDSLVAHVKKFNVQLDNYYDYSEFLKDWREIAVFGFMLSVTIRKIMITESEDAPNIVGDMDGFVNKIKISTEGEKIYHQQMKDIIKHFIDCNFM